MLAILMGLESNDVDAARRTADDDRLATEPAVERSQRQAGVRSAFPVTPPSVPSPRLVHARGVAETLAARAGDRLEMRQIAFAIEHEGGDLLGRGPAALKILLDLVEAALESLPEGGRLYASVRALANGTVELRVRDTGTGIPAAIVRRFRETVTPVVMAGFVPFGLVAARETAEGQRGRLEIVSRVGHGTGITVKLPPPPPHAALGGSPVGESDPEAA